MKQTKTNENKDDQDIQSKSVTNPILLSPIPVELVRSKSEKTSVKRKYSICDHENSWSNDLGNLISMIFFFLSKKRQKIMIAWSYILLFLWSMIQKAVISWFWSQQILWSRDYDLRKTVILNFKIIISRDPVVLIPTISVINVILDHWKWILMCEDIT